MTSSNSTATIRPRFRTPAVRKNSVAIVKRPETNRRRLSTPLQQPVVEKEVKVLSVLIFSTLSGFRGANFLAIRSVTYKNRSPTTFIVRSPRAPDPLGSRLNTPVT